MNYKVELSPKELIQRVGKVTQALFMDYPLKCSNGMTLKLNYEGKPYIVSQKSEDMKNWENCYIPAAFEVDTQFLYKEVQKMSDEDYFKLTSYVSFNENRYVCTREYFVDIDEDILLYNLLPHLKLTVTGAEVKRLIFNELIKINREIIKDIDYTVTIDMLKQGFDLLIGTKCYRIQKRNKNER